MKYIDEFRDGALARGIADAIANAAEPGRRYHLMEFCGGHTHAIHRYGVPDLLPDSVHMVHGPGCPVCVLPMSRLDSAIRLAREPGVILCTYADMLRVPGGSPGREVVFFAIGFETTTPPTAVAILRARDLGLDNFSVYCNHVLTPPAMQAILDAPAVRDLGQARIDGFVGPAHVSTVIGSRPYEHFAEEYQRPVVIAGFEPLDVMQAILMLVQQVNEGRAEVENEFTRAVTRDGNRKAQALIAEVLEMRRSFEWRGLGQVPYSGLRIREAFARFDAEVRFALQEGSWQDNRACECAAVLRGLREPSECKLFGTVCTPEMPVGPCMVSSEGACAAHYAYGRLRERRARETS